MIDKKIKKTMANVFKIPENSIIEESSPDTIEAWDSLQQMNLVLALEQSFSISFTDEEIIQLLSYELILETVKEKLSHE